MGKTRDDDLVITGTEKIIQDGNTIVDSDLTGNFDTVDVTTKLRMPTEPPSVPVAGCVWLGDPIPQPGPTRGVFGGGYHLGVTSVIDYVTISSTGDAAVFGNLTDARYSLAGTSNGTNDRGVFGGGYSFTGTPGVVKTIDYITISTGPTCTDFGDLLLAVPLSIGATSNDTNERGIFTGGASYSPSNAIDYITINSTGNATNFGGVLITNAYNIAGLSNGTNDRGCFNGNSSNAIAIDYITINSGSSAGDFGDLTEARSPSGATSNGTNERGVWAGGVGNISLTYSDVIDYITISSIGNATDFGDLTISMSALAGTSNLTDERGIFGGGYTGSDQSIISYITINSLSSAASFGNLTGLRRSMGACSG